MRTQNLPSDRWIALFGDWLGMLGMIEIEQPMVVVKSYPEFWEHLAKVGFLIETVTS